MKRCLFAGCASPWSGAAAHPHDPCAPVLGRICICAGVRADRHCHDWMPAEPASMRDRLVARILDITGADTIWVDNRPQAETIADRILTAYELTERPE